MFPLYLRLPDRKVLDPNGPYISTNQTKIRSVSLSVILEFCLPYFIQDHPNVTGFLSFETLCLGSSKTLPYVWKKYHKNEQHLCLVTHIFTKLSENVCLISTRILLHWYVRYNCKLWKSFWFHWVFSYIIDEHSCLKYYIFTKLSQIECLVNTLILICLHAMLRFSNSSVFFFW